MRTHSIHARHSISCPLETFAPTSEKSCACHLRFADRLLLLKDGLVHAVTSRNGLTAEAIREVYDVEVSLADLNGYPVVIPQ